MNNDSEHQEKNRINDVEMRMAFLEDTVEQLNRELINLSGQFSLARQAIQMLHKRIEQLDINDATDIQDDRSPPHY